MPPHQAAGLSGAMSHLKQSPSVSSLKLAWSPLGKGLVRSKHLLWGLSCIRGVTAAPLLTAPLLGLLSRGGRPTGKPNQGSQCQLAGGEDVGVGYKGTAFFLLGSS